MSNKINYDNVRVHGDIVIIEDVINLERCNQIIEECEKKGRYKKSSTVAEQSGFKGNILVTPRTSQSIDISHNTNLKELDKFLLNMFIGGVNVAEKELDLFEGFGHSCDEGYALLRYREGDGYTEHTDAMAESNPRIVSMLLYLNDDFEGGELVFNRQDLEIKPKAGSIVVFPSNWTHPHSSSPIIKGIKHAIVSWCR